MTKAEGVANSLTDYIVQPTNIGYQEAADYWELHNGLPSPKNLQSNNCYVSTLPSSMYQSGYDFTGLEYGLDWQYDYIWLPTLAETGRDRIISGISRTKGYWHVNLNQTVFSTNSSDHTWTRTINVANKKAYTVNNYYNAVCGENYVISNNYNVRPALHLNLTKAEAAANRFNWSELE